MPQKCNILLLILFACFSNALALDTDTTEHINNLKGNHKEKKINALWALSRYHKEVLGNDSKADSMALYAILLSETEKKTCTKLAAYLHYGRYYAPSNIERARAYLDKAIRLAEKEKETDALFDAQMLSAYLLHELGEKKEATSKLLTTVPLLQDDHRRNYWYNMYTAEIHDDFTELIISLQHYNQALQYATKLKNDSLQLYAHIRIIRMAAKNSLKQKADAHVALAEQLIASSKDFSLFDKLYYEAMKQTYHALISDPTLYEQGTLLMDQCEKSGFRVLFNDVLSTLRMSFMKRDDRKSLCLLYCQPKYFRHLQELKVEQPDMYLRINALLQEDRNQTDSAWWYWHASERELVQVDNAAYKANFYYRYGQFNYRQKNYMRADSCLQLAHSLAAGVNFFPLLIDISKLQEENYISLGNINLAYEALKRNRNYSDSSFNRLEQEKINLIEENSTRQLEEIASNIKMEEKSRRFTLQMFIVGLISILLLYVLVVFSKKQISISTIKMMGYITFVFLFEFLVFLLHKVFYKITDEPILLVFMNVALIAILLPIHHATEHRVMHYLLQRHRVHNEPTSLKKWLLKLYNNYRKWLNISEH